jgi:Rrf2 family iron-sulfur cluster assembly transcriptional regulator
MRLSTKAQYAVQAMVRLNIQQQDAPVSLREIAELEHISLTYLEQLFAKLRRGKLVSSVRGPGGGYLLARPAAEILIDQIIDCVDETLVPVSCMDEFGNCNCAEHCVAHSVWQELGARIRGFLASISVADLTDAAQTNKTKREAAQK